MNTKKSDNSISAHIAEARKSVNKRPDWMKSVAHFSEPRIELTSLKGAQVNAGAQTIVKKKQPKIDRLS